MWQAPDDWTSVMIWIQNVDIGIFNGIFSLRDGHNSTKLLTTQDVAHEFL